MISTCDFFSTHCVNLAFPKIRVILCKLTFVWMNAHQTLLQYALPEVPHTRYLKFKEIHLCTYFQLLLFSHSSNESFCYFVSIENLIEMKMKNILLGFFCVVVGGSNMASLRHLRSRLECPGGLVRPRYVMLYTSMMIPPRLLHVTSSVTSVSAAVINSTQKPTYPVCTLAVSIVSLTFTVELLIIFILVNTYLHTIVGQVS